MSEWTKPRAYIGSMTGRQTAELQRAAMERFYDMYAEHVAKLMKRERKGP